MKTNSIRKISAWFGIVSLSILSVACSSEKKTLVSKSYHNLTAHYNAYFLGKESLKEVKATYLENQEDNYYNVLRIFPKVDTVTASAVKEPLEDCIKKASLVIQNHKNSKWVDDGYVLLGKARFYGADFVNAIETFKYVNINSEDNNTRHEALVALMRTFIEYKEESNAIAVSDFLRKEKLNKNNLKELYLTRAYLYQQREDYNNMVKNLALASPLLEKEDRPARVHFIIGQVFQQLGFESLAYENYKVTLKNNPPYELSFYARLNMAQVFELADSKDVNKARKYFKNLLKDSKNKEFRDKIYYEMAEFEKNQENQELAIDYYKKSAQASVNNNRQKSYAFLRLGQIYYDEIKNYELAKAYYDSTIAVMPTDEPKYTSIKKRQEILADFVTQLNTIAVQDSLLNLAKMDSLSLVAMADNQFLERQEKIKKQEKDARRSTTLLEGQNNPFAQQGEASPGGTWYFYNPTSISIGEATFIRKWGKRPLQDNWRRREAIISGRGNQLAGPEENESPDTLASTAAGLEEQKIAYRKTFFGQIPFSEAAMAEVNKKIEDAYYTLGNIYNFNLEEIPNAKETYLTLLKRYPKTEYEPEVLYLLYLLSNDLQKNSGDQYKERLLSEYPNSTYSKTILNPNYKQESEAISAELKKMYADAFSLYESESFKAADSILSLAINNNAVNDFTDNLTLLQILIIGKTDKITNYQLALTQFIEKYPDSDVKEYAQKLLDVSKKFHPIEKEKSETSSYKENLEQEHLFVMVFDKGSGLSSSLPSKLDSLNNIRFSNLSLKSGNMDFNEEKAMVMVNEFKNKNEAFVYMNTLNNDNALKNEFTAEKVQEFIISKDNFQILYKTKDINSYVSFFEKHY